LALRGLPSLSPRKLPNPGHRAQLSLGPSLAKGWRRAPEHPGRASLGAKAGGGGKGRGIPDSLADPGSCPLKNTPPARGCAATSSEQHVDWLAGSSKCSVAAAAAATAASVPAAAFGSRSPTRGEEQGRAGSLSPAYRWPFLFLRWRSLLLLKKQPAFPRLVAW
jgi:hypothetical protein